MRIRETMGEVGTGKVKGKEIRLGKEREMKREEMGSGKGIEVGKKCNGMRIKRLDKRKGEIKSKFGKKANGR